jgi:two-component system response regulator NreC
VGQSPPTASAPAPTLPAWGCRRRWCALGAGETLGPEDPSIESESQISIVLADDHNVIRAGLRSMLEAEADLRVIGEAADSAAAKKLASDRRPNVLVLDLQMPGAEPARDIQALRENVPDTAIVVLTMQSDPRKARDLLRAGAAGYVLKQAADRKLTEAIRIAAGGGSYIDPELGGALAKLEADPLDDLSERERELLRLLAMGHTNREIGERLFLSVRAIEVNRAKLVEKLGLESRPDLVRFAIAHGVIAGSDTSASG